MHPDSLLLAFFVTDLVACFLPGPAVLAVASLGLSGSLRGVAGAIAGINISNMIWYAMVGLGLIALVHTVPELFTVLRWVGTAYLFWLGVQTWRHPAHLRVAGAQHRIGFGRGLAGAVAVQLSNPKAMIFFTVFLPPFINLHHPIVPQILRLASIGIVIEVVALAFYGLLAYRLGQLAVTAEAGRRIGRISGSILMAIAVAMALSQLL